MTESPSDVPPDLQAEAEEYQAAYALTNATYDAALVSRTHNRQWGRALMARLRSAGIHTVRVGNVLLRPHADGRGFDRIPVGPASVNAARTTAMLPKSDAAGCPAPDPSAAVPTTLVPSTVVAATTTSRAAGRRVAQTQPDRQTQTGG